MASYSTTGIVIGRTNFGEADRIVRLLTADHGKISVVARGVRKIKSRMAGHLELFGEVGLMLVSGKNLDTITSARLAWYPHRLTESYRDLGLAYMCAAMIDRLVEERQAQPEVYELLGEALRAIEAGAGGPLVELWFKLRLLGLLGYHPELSHCVVCGTSDEAQNYAFSAERGGIVDVACAPATGRPMPIAAIKLWRLMMTQPYSTITRVGGGEELAATTLAGADEFYQYHLGRSFAPSVAGTAGERLV